MTLEVDEERVGNYGETGIYVRAKNKEGRVINADIVDLKKESLLAWLTSRGGSNPWAEDVIGIVFGHGHLHDHA